MHKQTDSKIIIIKRKTRLEEILYKFNTIAQAQFYIEHLGGDFSDYLDEDTSYKKQLQQLQHDLSSIARLQIVDRDLLSNFIFASSDIIVVVGQDGLVANTMKYLHDHPVIAVNPDPNRWDGILLPFQVNDVKKILADFLNNIKKFKEITFAKVETNNGQHMYAVNDFFIGAKTHTSARYLIKHHGQHEQQSSSGIIVSTGLGSSGWLKSVMTGAHKIARNKRQAPLPNITWDAHELIFSVREPFPSKNTGVDIVYGTIKHHDRLEVESLMGSQGVIFSDGVETDFLEFNSGTKVAIKVATDKRGYLVV